MEPLHPHLVRQAETMPDMTIAALQDMGYQVIYIDQYAFG